MFLIALVIKKINENRANVNKGNKAMFFMAPREVSNTHVSKSEWTSKQKIGANFMTISFYCKRLIVMIEKNI